MRHSILGMVAVFVAPAAMMLAGCGSQQAQGKAFVTFLQTRILDKPGVHVPRLTDEEKASFGHYADDYAIITDFNQTMDQSISPKLTSAMTTGSVRSLGDLVARRTQLGAAKTTLGAMSTALGGNIARADAAHAKLDQPPEVKAVFDKAYDRLVAEPAKVFRETVPAANTVLGQAIDLGNYIDQHRAGVTMTGSTIAAADPAVRDEINNRLRAIQTSQQAVQAGLERFQALVYGSGT